MKTTYKSRLAAGMIICAVFISNMVGSCVAASSMILPGAVRVGLFHGGTAVASFNISSEKGLELGYIKDNKFNLLMEEMTKAALIVRKDGYILKNNSTYAEYNPSDKKALKGEKLGPYHIELEANCADLDSAGKKVLEFKKKGIDAYPAYIDGWQVWTGFYTDVNSVEADIVNNIEKKLGKAERKVIEPSGNRIAVLTADGGTMLMFGSDKGQFQIRPRKDNNPYALKLNDKSYRGDIEVRRIVKKDSKSDMTVINILPLEQYLYGVVPSEIEAYANPEALKAQAVTARTYTLNNIRYKKHDEFDLCDTIDCQVYKGLNGEQKSTNKAVDDTKSKIITYNGKIAEVFYFASDGGRTEDAKNVWGSDIPYLRSVEDKYETGKSYNYTWKSVFEAGKIKEMLLARGLDLGNITSIAVTKRSEAGRVTEVVIKGTKGQKVYALERSRTAFGLNSQWYTLTTDADVIIKTNTEDIENVNLGGVKLATSNGVKTINPKNGKITVVGANGEKKTVSSVPSVYTFNGRGWGHAIGMSQEGAKGMANAGFKYDQILMHYFTGTKVE